jgi:predicted ATP-grasp superfamily ATP-dependent carboligase
MGADYAQLQNVVDKTNLYEQAEKAGLNTIPAIVAPTPDEVAAWSIVHPAPYLIKPVYAGVPTARLKQKNMVVPSREALLAFVNQGEMQSLIVQRVIPSANGYIFDCYGYCNRGGQVVAMASKRRLHRHLPDYGSCTMGEIPAYLDDTTEATRFEGTKRLFRQIRYHGIFGVEWLLDRNTGTFYVIDFNARPFMSIGHVAAAGSNLRVLAYAETTGEDICVLQQMPRLKRLIGVDLLRDLESFLVKRVCGNLSVAEWLRALAQCQYFYYADWRDPGPAFRGGWRIFAPSGLSSLAGRRLRWRRVTAPKTDMAGAAKA